MALRAIAGERVSLTLIAPDADFSYRPMAVAEPFALGSAHKVPLSKIAEETGPEHAPLSLFGEEAGAAVSDELARAGIELTTGVVGRVEPGGLALEPGGEHLAVQRIFAVPRVLGPHLEGLPADDEGFVLADDSARVEGCERTWAAGDGVVSPVKFGGLATHQARRAVAALPGVGRDRRRLRRGARCSSPVPRWRLSVLGRRARRGCRGEHSGGAVGLAAGGKADGGGESDEGRDGQGDHRPARRRCFGGEVGDQDRAGDRGAEGRSEVGDAARQLGDLGLQLLGEAGLYEVDRGGQHDPEAEADQQQAGPERDDARGGPTRASRSPIPAIVTTKPAMIRVFCGRRLASRSAASDETRTPTVAAVKMTPVSIAL
jgi:hypothetical protein